MLFLVLGLMSIFAFLAANRTSFKTTWGPATFFMLCTVPFIVPFKHSLGMKLLMLGTSWTYAAAVFFILSYFERSVILSVLVIGLATTGVLVAGFAKVSKDLGPWANRSANVLTGKGWGSRDLKTAPPVEAPRD